MTPTQLEKIKGEFEAKFIDYQGMVDEDAVDVWQWFESKLEEVEEEVKQDLESNNIEVELDTEQCSEIALMVYEKYLEWLKKPQYIIIPFNEWVERNLKSNKLEKPKYGKDMSGSVDGVKAETNWKLKLYEDHCKREDKHLEKFNQIFNKSNKLDK